MDSKLYVKRFDTGATVDVSEDFSLPDYQPEVRRIVGIRASTTIDGKYLSGDELEADGGITYTVLYIDEGGHLAQSSQTSSYTGRVPLKTENDLYGVGDILVSASLENVNCRVTAPRKFSLSSRVRMNIISQKCADAELKTDGALDVRRKTETLTTACLADVRKSCAVEGVIHEQAGSKIVMAQGEVAIGDTRIDSADRNEAAVKGEAFLTLLIETPDGTFATVRSREPIDERISLPESAAGATRAAAFGSVAMTEVSFDENGEIAWRMEYDLDCDIMKIKDAEITKDAYLTDFDDKLTESEYFMYRPALAVNGRLTTSGSLKLRENMAYLTAWGNGEIEKCEIADGHMKMSGSAHVTVVTFGGGEAVEDALVIPFRYECDCMTDGVHDDASIVRRTSVAIPEVTVRQNGDALDVTAELSISAVALAAERAASVVGISQVGDGKKNGERRGMIRVYVPDEGESAWDVEKKFRLAQPAERDGRMYVI